MSLPTLVDPWGELRHFTNARIALGRSGASLTTRVNLEIAVAQAQAHDAVHAIFDDTAIVAQLTGAGLNPTVVHSAAVDRYMYLRRPDLGRRLDVDSRERLIAQQRELQSVSSARIDTVFVIADGLSAAAPVSHAVPLLLRILQRMASPLRLGPVIIAHQARVALADEIGDILNARQTVMLIGERPGLTTVDSLGAYFTHDPKPGRTDAERNCISNVHLNGLSYELAAHRLDLLMRIAGRLGYSGVGLKDDSESPALSGYGFSP